MRSTRKKAIFNAENMEAARLEVINDRVMPVGEAPLAPIVQANKITRFQASEQHKPR